MPDPTPLADLAADLRAGRRDVGASVRAVCERLAAVDPAIRAFLPEPGRRDRLVAVAGGLAARWPAPAARPPLYGVPVGVKDVIRVDGLPTRAGSRLPAALFAGPEAACVAALREAGALVLGKTVTAEFALAEPGPTRNPHRPGHTPGGSSSGSAAAVAAGLCPLALGTQTTGSVIRPAAFCGVVGVVPTRGRVPADGVVPCAPSLDRVGFFAADVAGARLAAAVLCADWPPAPAGPTRPVLGVPDGPYLDQASAEGRALFEAQVARLAAAGYAVRRIPAFADIAAINARQRALVAGELAAVHAAWFARHAPRYRPRTAAAIRAGRAIAPAALAAARAGCAALRARLEAEMAAAGIDLWICPAATGPAPEGLASTGDPSLNLPWSQAGLPAVTVPAGRAADGLPVGLQCVARGGADEALLAWAVDLAAAVGDGDRPGAGR